jgi:hypothetical protein
VSTLFHARAIFLAGLVAFAAVFFYVQVIRRRG